MASRPAGMENEEVQRMLETAQKSFTAPSFALHLAGVLMAVCGGMINTISFMDLGSHTFTSHLTGTTTKLGIRAAGYDLEPSDPQKKEDAEEAASTVYALLLLVFFMAGSGVSGMVISRNAVNVGRSAYGLVLLISAALLAIAAFSDISSGKPIGALACAMACGIQNGMVSTYSGNIIRTTHVTGTWTDCGLSIGRVLANLLRNGWSQNPVDRAWLTKDFARGRLMFMLGFGFLTGCYLGAHLHGATIGTSAHKKTLLIPASILALGGLGHAFYVCFVLKINFWELVQSSSRNPQKREVLLYIDGEVYDLPTGASVLSQQASSDDGAQQASSMQEGLRQR